MKKLTFLFAFILIIFMLFGCSSKKVELNQITFNDDSVNLIVEISEFNLSDYKITANYSDGTSKNIAIDKSMLSADDFALLSTVGTHTVTINYEGALITATFTLYENVTVTVDPAGGVLVGPNTITVKKGERLTELPSATKGDLELLGWTLVDGTEFNLDTIVNSNITIIADWNDIKSIHLKEESIPTEVMSGNFSLAHFILIITYDNNRLDEVNVTSEMLSAEDNAKIKTLGTHSIKINYLNQVFECTFTIYEEVKVSIIENGGILEGSNSLIIRKGSKLSALPVITKVGIELLGWKLQDGTPFTLDTIINEDITIIAYWKDISSIELDTSGLESDLIFGEFSIDEIKIIVKYVNNEEDIIGCTKDFMSQSDFDSLSTPGDKRISITYRDYNALINFKLLDKFTITFHPNEGQLVGPSSVEVVEGKKLSAFSEVSKDDYDLLGWETSDGIPFTLDTVITKDTNLYAKWDDVPNSEKAKITYHYLDELEVDSFRKGAFINQSGKIYLPSNDSEVYNTKTKDVYPVYINIDDYLGEVLKDGETIVEILYLDPFGEKGIVVKSNYNNYYGNFTDNQSGQYGLGHSENIESNLGTLFTNISLADDEEIITVYVNYTYNIVITNQNRVFFTGGLGDEYPIYNIPQDITAQFDLGADERFLSDAELYEQYEFYSNRVIYTNKRIFGLADLFTGNDTTGKAFVDLANIFSDDILFIITEDTGYDYSYITKDGKIKLYDSQSVEPIDIINIGINEDETIISASFQASEYALIIFKTSQNKFILFDGEESKIAYTSDILPESVGVIKNIYVYRYLIIIENTVGEIYYIDGENIDDGIVVNDISDLFNGAKVEIYIDNIEFIYMIYFVVDEEIYGFENDDIIRYNFLSLKTRTELHKKDTEITLPDYAYGDFLINGWTVDFEAILGEKLVVLDNMDIFQLLPEIGRVNIIFDFNGIDYWSKYFYIPIGEKFIKEDFYNDLEEFFVEHEIVYGNINNYILVNSYEHELFDFDTPISSIYTFLDVSIDEEILIPVSITYYDTENQIVGYDQVFVGNGGTIEDFYLEFNFENKYSISKYYSKLNEIEFNPTTPIMESMYLDIALVEKVPLSLTIIMPNDIDNLVFTIYKGNSFPYDDVYPAIYEIQYNSKYRLYGFYLDELFTESFSEDIYIAKEDTVLYAKMNKGIDVYLNFFENGNELKKFHRSETLYFNDRLTDLGIPYGYNIVGVYTDSEKTNEISIYDDLGIDILYIELEKSFTETLIEVDFIFPQINMEYKYSEMNSNRNKYEIVSNIINYTLGTYIYDRNVYSDLDMTNEIDVYDFELYEKLYIYISILDEGYNKITLNFIDSNLESLEIYLPIIEYLNINILIERLQSLYGNYHFEVNQIYSDLAGTEIFDIYSSDSYSDGLELYVDITMTEIKTLTIKILNGPEIIIDNTNFDNYSLIEMIYNYLDNIYFYYNYEDYQIGIYSDPDYLNRFTEGTGYNELVLYGKLEAREKINLSLIFSDGKFETIDFDFIKGEYCNLSILSNIIYNKYSLEFDEFEIYINSELTELYSYYDNISEDSSFYVKKLAKINLFFPGIMINDEYIVLGEDGVVNVAEIENILSNIDYESNYEVELFTDIRMTVPYENQELQDGDYLFVSFVATKNK